LVTSRTGWIPKTDLDSGLEKTIKIWQDKIQKN
jgi:dTDP-D-glucose 4,6-dehydratase